MKNRKKKQVALFRLRVIYDFVGNTKLPRGAKERLLREKCSLEWEIPFSQRTRLSRGTILRWITIYKKNDWQVGSLYPRGRSDTLNVKQTVTDGVIYRRYAADKANCKGCTLKVKCLRNKTAKRKIICVPIGSVPGNLTKAMQEKIDSDQGRKIYSQRIAIVEPVFANIRTHKQMNRLTLRGEIKATYSGCSTA